jgi:hypothetical protein
MGQHRGVGKQPGLRIVDSAISGDLTGAILGKAGCGV